MAYVTGVTRHGRRMLVDASEVAFAIETTHKSPDRMVNRQVVAGETSEEVHIVLRSGEQGDMAVSWESFLIKLTRAQEDVAVAEDQDARRPPRDTGAAVGSGERG